MKGHVPSSVVLPKSNERGNDPIDAIEAQVAPVVATVQILVAYENSPDGTAGLLRQRAYKPDSNSEKRNSLSLSHENEP